VFQTAAYNYFQKVNTENRNRGTSGVSYNMRMQSIKCACSARLTHETNNYALHALSQHAIVLKGTLKMLEENAR
jgi:hypothetical protein